MKTDKNAHIELLEYAELRREYADLQGRFNELLRQYSNLLARMEKILDSAPLSTSRNVISFPATQSSAPKFTVVEF